MDPQQQTQLSLRNAPVQSRSRIRLNNILQTAEVLIAENGTDRLKMNDVATRAGVPIGAVYNFFPNKASLVAHLLKQHLTMMTSNEEVTRMLTEATKRQGDYAQTVAGSLVAVHHYVRRNKVFREIWSGAQAMHEIRMIDLEDSTFFARRLVERIREYNAGVSEDDLFAKALIICHLTGSIMRLSAMLDKQLANRAVRSYIEMALLHIGFSKKVIEQVKIDL